MSGFTTSLVEGAAQYVAAAGVGVWRPTGIYQPSEIGWYVRDVPPSPDRVITIASYPVSSTPGLADVIEGLQIRVRGTQDPRVAGDLGDAIFDVLDSAEGLNWGGIAVVQVYRQSYTALGKDERGRWEISHNYYVEAMRPTSNRTD
ncbi:minor capsid protein [Actinoplanes sp. Pm04-4]|uniref:Minor capsid protein n=1 Tax=Paractinoplanes pyxinae TaxID=2997416 RepID=A0ABT4B4H6_9ACTN|nr:minor capsid protein [Actinoplanes pyxinae]MCY1141381.1 minor capsid protein [Actinoplanes pyxinae]